MDGKALQSQPCGPGRGPFQYDPLSSPPTRPDAVVGEGLYVNVNVNGYVNGNVTVNANRNVNGNQNVNRNVNVNQNVNVNRNVNVNHNASHSGCIKDGRKSPQQNDSAGMLHHQVSDKLKICDDVKVSQTRTSTPTHQTETEPLERITEDNGGVREKEPFDICLPNLLVNNRESRKKMKQSSSTSCVLRPGMVLLKSYISLSKQVGIVKKCRELGMGRGGFYDPACGDGTKLHLKMMRLGRNCYPQTSQYGHQRPSDGSHPPPIPHEFPLLVREAIVKANSVIQQHSKTPNSDSNPLTSFATDICIVNFYSQNGRLDLHQDKDESEDSIRRGLPVVSFSIGDSAVFSYGDERDGHKKIVLESGDVLIFGGKSRNIFHGITAIHQMTAPNSLLQQTNLRPGRLNLTFRKY